MSIVVREKEQERQLERIIKARRIEAHTKKIENRNEKKKKRLADNASVKGCCNDVNGKRIRRRKRLYNTHAMLDLLIRDKRRIR